MMKLSSRRKLRLENLKIPFFLSGSVKAEDGLILYLMKNTMKYFICKRKNISRQRKIQEKITLFV